MANITKTCGETKQIKYNANNNDEAQEDRNHQTQDIAENPLELIPKLCNHFYHLGWASGTGGGLSIRAGNRIYCAPSGVQKERIKTEDMFVLDELGDIIKRPQNPKLKCSECLPLFMVAFKLRNAGCCIHSHSIDANLITALYSKRNIEFKEKNDKRSIQVGENGNVVVADNNEASQAHGQHKLSSYIKTPNEFRISNQEMIKGIKRGSSNQPLQYDSTLIVPIIDNVLHEHDLADSMFDAVSKYPLTNAVLVRNHGVYVWGNTWEQAKSMAECYHYLFKLKLEAIKYGFDWMLQE